MIPPPVIDLGSESPPPRSFPIDSRYTPLHRLPPTPPPTEGTFLSSSILFISYSYIFSPPL